MARKEDDDALLERLDARTKRLESWRTRQEYETALVTRIVYGAVGTILLGFMAAMIAAAWRVSQ